MLCKQKRWTFNCLERAERFFVLNIWRYKEKCVPLQPISENMGQLSCQ